MRGSVHELTSSALAGWQGRKRSALGETVTPVGVYRSGESQEICDVSSALLIFADGAFPSSSGAAPYALTKCTVHVLPSQHYWRRRGWRAWLEGKPVSLSIDGLSRSTASDVQPPPKNLTSVSAGGRRRGTGFPGIQVRDRKVGYTVPGIHEVVYNPGYYVRVIWIPTRRG